MGVLLEALKKHSPDEVHQVNNPIGPKAARAHVGKLTAVGEDAEAGAGHGQQERQLGTEPTAEVDVVDPIERAARRIAEACGVAYKPTSTGSSNITETLGVVRTLIANRDTLHKVANALRKAKGEPSGNLESATGSASGSASGSVSDDVSSEAGYDSDAGSMSGRSSGNTHKLFTVGSPAWHAMIKAEIATLQQYPNLTQGQLIRIINNSPVDSPELIAASAMLDMMAQR